MNVVDGQRDATPLDFAGEVKDAGKKAAVLAVLVEYSLVTTGTQPSGNTDAAGASMATWVRPRLSAMTIRFSTVV